MALAENTSPYALLKASIIAGDFTPGGALVESALARRYDVSRTPIREALRRLESEGLVERIGARLQVREYQPEEMLDLYEVRSFLEEAAAKTAARRHTQMDLVLIERAHAAMREMDVASATPAELAEANRTFHERIWDAAHSAALRDFLDRILVHFIRYPGTTLASPGRWEAVLAEHDALVEAIRARDADAAARISSEHMEHARNIRIEMYIDERESPAAP